MPKRDPEDDPAINVFEQNTSNLTRGSDRNEPRPPVQLLDVEALINQPPVTFEVGRRTAGQGSDVISFRVPRPVAADWRRWCQIVQAVLDIPDGVLPHLAFQVLQDNREELLRRYQQWHEDNQ